MADVRQTTKTRSGRGSLKDTPAAPTGVVATPTSPTTILIDWNTPYSSSAKTTAISGWKVYRSLTTGSGFSLRAAVTVSQYEDTVTEGVTYYYKVTAVGINESSYSSEVSATAQGDYQAPAWTIPDLVGVDANLGTVIKGGTASLASYYSANDGTPYFTISSITAAGGSDTSGITINSSTGTISVSETTPADTYTVSVSLASAATEITTLNVSGTGAWTFGQAFKQGDAPDYVALSGGQAEVRNRWPDGSVKFAVLSGYGSTSYSITTSATDTMTGTAVAEPTLAETSVDLGAFGKATLVRTSQGTWNKATAGRVRSIPGPVMSEFHYYAPAPSDAHLAVWWYVRAYANGQVEVETVVENGWLNVLLPGQRDYTPTVRVNGSIVYSGVALNHYHHTRWSRADWTSGSALTPTHNGAYLRSTKLVPNYGATSPTSAAFTGLASAINPTPFALGNWSPAMEATGYQAAIGLLPQWEALYCTSTDSRAYAATISNNRGSGRWPIHYRDETTGRVPLFASYPTMVLTSGWGTQPPAPSGGQAGAWDMAHHPSNGFLPYLIEGRWSQLESLQFSASFAILEGNPTFRNTTGGGVIAAINSPHTTRGAAWAWRTVGQAATISPDSIDATQKAQFTASIANTAAFLKSRYITGSTYSGAHVNSVGWVGQYDGGDVTDGTNWWGRQFMVAFQQQAMGYVSDLGVTAPDLVDVRSHVYDGVVRLLGTDATWNFRRAALYNAPYLKNGSTPAAPQFMSTAEAFDAYLNRYSLAALSANSGDTLKQHESDADVTVGASADYATGYGAQFMCGLAYAVDHGKHGASAGYALVTAASNFSRSGADDKPQWSVVPR